MKLKKTCVLCASFALGICLTASGAGEAQIDPDFRPPITLFRNSVKLREALRLISAPDPSAYFVRPEVPDVTVTLNLDRLTMQQSARVIIRQAGLLVPGLTYSRDGGPYVVAQREMEKDPVSEAPLTFRTTKGEAAAIWAMIFESTKVRTELPKEVQKLPIEVRAKETPRREVVYDLVRQLSKRTSNLSVGSADWMMLRVEPLRDAKRNGR